jgi:hypothetical protein
VVLALWWAGSAAVVAVLLIVALAPFAALGCPGSCDGEPMSTIIGRLALGIVGGFAVLTVTALLLLARARRTRRVAIPLGMIGFGLLLPTALAAGTTLTSDASGWWIVIWFASVGVPGLCLLSAARQIWRAPPPRSA